MQTLMQSCNVFHTQHVIFFGILDWAFFQSCDVFIQSVIICLGFLFSQPQTYKRIILRTVNGDTSCTSVEQNLFKQIVTGDRICPSSSFLCKSCCVCTPQGFITKNLLDLHRLDELKNFAPNNLLQLVIEVAYWDPRNWLVTYQEPCITRRDCHYRTSPIGYWGKGSIVGWYMVLGFLYL